MFTSLLFFLLFNLSYAKEPPKEAAKEAAKEALVSQQPAWIEIEMKITELATKIKGKELKIESLLVEKNALPANSPLVKDLLQQIVTEHKDLQKTIDDYEKKRTVLKYRYPERGTKVEQTYKKVPKKSIQEVEVALGLEGKLNRNIQRMRSQYNHEKFKETKEEEIKKQPIKTQKQEPSIEEEGAILLRK